MNYLIMVKYLNDVRLQKSLKKKIIPISGYAFYKAYFPVNLANIMLRLVKGNMEIFKYILL